MPAPEATLSKESDSRSDAKDKTALSVSTSALNSSVVPAMKCDDGGDVPSESTPKSPANISKQVKAVRPVPKFSSKPTPKAASRMKTRVSTITDTKATASVPGPSEKSIPLSDEEAAAAFAIPKSKFNSSLAPTVEWYGNRDDESETSECPEEEDSPEESLNLPSKENMHKAERPTLTISLPASKEKISETEVTPLMKASPAVSAPNPSTVPSSTQGPWENSATPTRPFGVSDATTPTTTPSSYGSAAYSNTPFGLSYGTIPSSTPNPYVNATYATPPFGSSPASVPSSTPSPDGSYASPIPAMALSRRAGPSDNPSPPQTSNNLLHAPAFPQSLDELRLQHQQLAQELERVRIQEEIQEMQERLAGLRSRTSSQRRKGGVEVNINVRLTD